MARVQSLNIITIQLISGPRKALPPSLSSLPPPTKALKLCSHFSPPPSVLLSLTPSPEHTLLFLYLSHLFKFQNPFRLPRGAGGDGWRQCGKLNLVSLFAPLGRGLSGTGKGVQERGRAGGKGPFLMHYCLFPQGLH